MARCKHTYVNPVLVGHYDAYDSYYSEACAHCGKHHKRYLDDGDRSRERQKVICGRCEMFNADHESSDAESCVKLLFSRVKRLEELVSDLQSWRNS